MGLVRSAVLSTLPNPRLALAAGAVVAPVPPLATATTPVMLAALPVTLPVMGLVKVLTPPTVWLVLRSTKSAAEAAAPFTPGGPAAPVDPAAPAGP